MKIEITDKQFRAMLDKAGLQDVRLFVDGDWIITRKGDTIVSANEMAFKDITRKQWVKTIEHWIKVRHL